jgi:hypothetical protein
MTLKFSNYRTPKSCKERVDRIKELTKELEDDITARRVMEITGCVYRDSMDYVYQTLGRMVKAGLIKRTGPGVFGPKGGGE